MDSELSQRHIDMLVFIKEYIVENGYPPSVREIGSAVSLKSSASAHTHLSKLEELGYIKRDATKPRALKILK